MEMKSICQKYKQGSYVFFSDLFSSLILGHTFLQNIAKKLRI